MSLDGLTELDKASTVQFGSHVNAEEVENLFAYLALSQSARVWYQIKADKEVGNPEAVGLARMYHALPKLLAVGIKGEMSDRTTSLHFDCLRSKIDLGDADVTRFYGIKFDMPARNRLNEVPQHEQELMQKVRQLTEEYFLRLRAKPENDE